MLAGHACDADRHGVRHGQLKDESVIKAIYRRAAGPGVLLMVEGESLDAIRERLHTLPFVTEELMTLEYEEIYAI